MGAYLLCNGIICSNCSSSVEEGIQWRIISLWLFWITQFYLHWSTSKHKTVNCSRLQLSSYCFWASPQNVSLMELLGFYLKEHHLTVSRDSVIHKTPVDIFFFQTMVLKNSRTMSNQLLTQRIFWNKIKDKIVSFISFFEEDTWAVVVLWCNPKLNLEQGKSHCVLIRNVGEVCCKVIWVFVNFQPRNN